MCLCITICLIFLTSIINENVQSLFSLLYIFGQSSDWLQGGQIQHLHHHVAISTPLSDLICSFGGSAHVSASQDHPCTWKIEIYKRLLFGLHNYTSFIIPNVDLSSLSNQNITFIVTSPQHLVSEILESVLQTVQKQFTHRQYILTDLYRRQCAKYTYIYSVHIHILSTHSVLLDILTVINTHYTPYVQTLHYEHVYNNMWRCNRLYITWIPNVMDVHCMVSSGSR